MLELQPVYIDADDSMLTVDQIPPAIDDYLDLYSEVYDVTSLGIPKKIAMLQDLAGSANFGIIDTAEPDIYVGVLSYYCKPSEGTLFLEGLAVAPALRGQKIVGPFAIKEVVRRAADRSLQEVRLQAKPERVSFYVRNGFECMRAARNGYFLMRHII